VSGKKVAIEAIFSLENNAMLNEFVQMSGMKILENYTNKKVQEALANNVVWIYLSRHS